MKMPLNVGVPWTDITNTLFSWLTFVSKNDNEPFFSISDLNLNLLCYLSRYHLNFSTCVDRKMKMYINKLSVSKKFKMRWAGLQTKCQNVTKNDVS